MHNTQVELWVYVVLDFGSGVVEESVDLICELNVRTEGENLGVWVLNRAG